MNLDRAMACVADRALGIRARVVAGIPGLPVRHQDAFDMMESTFLVTGGVLTGDDLVELMRPRIDQPLSAVARWIHDRRIVSYERRGQHRVPLFQFDRVTMDLHPGVTMVLDELRGVLPASELALWFASANAWLGGAIPAARVGEDAAAVVEAARSDHS